MLPLVTDAPILSLLETYYDAAPRPLARTEQVGPFTFFVRTDPGGWPFYAQPRLGLTESVTAAEVSRARDRLRELESPDAFEWVEETTPSLSAAAPSAGLTVTRCQLLTLPAEGSILPGHAEDLGETRTPRVRMVGPDDPDLPRARVYGRVGFTRVGTACSAEPSS